MTITCSRHCVFQVYYSTAQKARITWVFSLMFYATTQGVLKLAQNTAF